MAHARCPWSGGRSADEGAMTSRRRRFALVFAVLALVVRAAGVFSLTRGAVGDEPAALGEPAASTTTAGPTSTIATTAPAPHPEVPVSTPLATPHGVVPTFDGP